jgi:hypothetical protein
MLHAYTNPKEDNDGLKFTLPSIVYKWLTGQQW